MNNHSLMCPINSTAALTFFTLKTVIDRKYKFIFILLFLWLTPALVSAALPDYRAEQYGTTGRYFAIHLNDMDSDGVPEVLIGNRTTNSLEIWKYNSTSKVLSLNETITFPHDVHDIKVADLDHDGDKDVVVGLRFYGLYVALKSGSTWAKKRIDGTYSWEVLLNDFNQDGHLDIYETVDRYYLKVFYGDGAGNFVYGPTPPRPPVSFSRPVGFNAVDLNGDNRTDLIGPAREGLTYYLRAFLNLDNNGEVSWHSVGPDAGLTGTKRIFSYLSPSAADIDNNGYIDQVVYNLDNDIIVYEGASSAGELTWTPRTIDTLSSRIGTIGIADFNEDGYLDIHVQGWLYFSGIRIYLGDGAGNYTLEILPLAHGVGPVNSLRFGDINGDGATDIATIRYDGIGDSGFFEVLYQVLPTEMMANLIETVSNLNLQQGIENSLDVKLDAAVKALQDLNVNNDVVAINALQAFINAVEGQRGNKITDDDADLLISAAQAIINRLTAT